MIEVVDYQSIDPFSIDVPTWFDRYERFQTIALEAGKKRRRLVGRWEFRVSKTKWRTVIDSNHTRVINRARRAGIAVRLWELGIEIWQPNTIKAAIGSYAGCALLAKMRARLAGSPVFLDVDLEIDNGEWRNTFHRLTAEAAEKEIRRLRKPPTTRKLEAVP